MIINYKAPKTINVKTIKITWRNKALPNMLMKEDNDHNLWKLEVNLPKGKYYYHYIINDILHLNDPNTNLIIPGKDETIWSSMLIDKDGNRIYYDLKFSIELISSFMSNRIIEYNNTNLVEKKSFNLCVDNMVSIRYDFTNVTGIHAVNLLWINPFNEIFDISENTLYQEDKELSNILSVWFNLHLNNKEYDIKQGLWKVQLFIDGEYIMEDYFQLGQGAIYTNNGRLIIGS